MRRSLLDSQLPLLASVDLIEHGDRCFVVYLQDGVPVGLEQRDNVTYAYARLMGLNHDRPALTRVVSCDPLGSVEVMD